MLRIILLALTLTACVAPTQHDPTHWTQPVTVEFIPSVDGVWDWSRDQLVQAQTEIDVLGALGPNVWLIQDGTAHYSVRAWYSNVMCSQGVGRWFPGETTAEVDQSCAHGDIELRAAIGHEIGHMLNLHHVCFTAGESADCDTAIAPGPAMMNPSVSYGDVLDMTSGLTGVAQDTPTQADLDEYRSVHP